MASTTFISSAFFFLFLLLTSFSEAHFDNILYSGESLQAGEYLKLSIYTFILQEDCNLVLYQNGNDPLWVSNTGWRESDCYLTLEKDGNLVIYDETNGSPIWTSNTSRGQGNYVLILQKNRNVVIYGGPIWGRPITNLPSPIIYTHGIDLAKNVTTGVTGRITTRAGKVA